MLEGQRDAAFDLDEYEDEVEEATKGEKPKKVSDKKLLQILAAQKGRSIGFDNDKELNTERADALDYYKGKHEGAIARDLPTAENRSKVVDTTVSNTVEMALPDIVAVFTAGEDPLTFKAVGLEDEAQAKQETDYVRHIIFSQNRGWMLLYTGFKDALISKTGIFHFYWDNDAEYEEYTAEASEPQIEEIEAAGNEVVEAEPTNVVNMDGFPVFKVTFRKKCSDGHVSIQNVPPEDFTVHTNTNILSETEYCAMRTRTSRQALIDEGYDRGKVMKLEASEIDEDERQSRDTAEENTDEQDGGYDLLEMVDIVTHYIRLDIEGKGKRQIWRVVTGNDEEIELGREKRSMIEFAALVPFPMPHRFYGQSLADKLIQTQKWKTSVTRQVNDHLYFANNQRQEVKKGGIVPGITIEQLTDNAPGQPVITEDGQSLRPIQNGTLGIDALGLLEYIATDAELRSGVMRYGSGMNPDALHETKGGSDNQLNAAQKRAKLMAALFANTGMRDLFMGVHETARQNATMEDTVKLRGTWVPVSPGGWQRRKDMEVDPGIGSSGTEEDIARSREWRGHLTSLVEAQGGMDGPLINKKNIYHATMALADKLRVKGATLQVTDPEKEEQAKALAGDTEQPPSEADMLLMAEQQKEKIKVEGQIEIEKFKASVEQQKLSIELEKFKMKLAADEAAAQRAHELAMAKITQDATIAQQKMSMDLMIHREKEARENKKIDTESQYVLLEQEKAAREQQSEEMRAELAARETAARERNDALKIAADERKMQREEVMDMRKIALEDRKIALEEKRLEVEASMPPEAPAAAAQPSDKGANDGMAAAVLAVAAALSKPKTATRPDGSKITIE
jgi:hypothetical protein